MHKATGFRGIAYLANSQAILLASATFFGIACDRVNEGMVAGSTPDPSCDGCYFSEVDNPEITRWDILRPIDNDAEYAQREGNAWVFNNFDLHFKAWGGDQKKGAITNYDLFPKPSTNGLWDATHEDVRMPWRVRGIELGYSRLNAAATHRDLHHSPTDVPAVPVRVSLDPNTILVPVQVIRVMPPRTSPYNEEMQLETYERWKNFFDDLPAIKREYRVSHPGGKVNVRVGYKETPIPQSFYRADEIFKQCGIQFRMIDCAGSARGCPDLHVQQDQYVAPTTCTGNNPPPRDYPEVRQNWIEAKTLPGVDPHLPVVILMVRPEGSDCLDVTFDVATTGMASFSTRSRFESAYTPAHELGHVLGLSDVNCTGSTKGLMCNIANESERLTATQCQAARRKAAEYAQRKWGVSITP